MRRKISDEARKILDARKNAAAELKALDNVERQITDPAVIRLAHARLYEAAIMMKIIAGENIAASEFKASNDMVEAARQSAKDAAPIGVNVRYVHRASGPPTAAGAFPEVALTLEQVRQLGRAEAAAEAAAKKLMPPQKVVAPTPDAKPHQATSSGPKRPTPPAKKDPVESNRQFHAGGYVREARMSDGWMSNMGAMSRRRNESNRTHYQPWPNPTREH